MEKLASQVFIRTSIPNGYRAHAAHQSMTVYLEDWERALERLSAQVEVLRALRDARIVEAESGSWPTERTTP